MRVAEPGVGAKTRLRKTKNSPPEDGSSLIFCESLGAVRIRLPPVHGSFGQRPYSLQPGVERPKNAQRFGRATPG
jgi:hypothetical protein